MWSLHLSVELDGQNCVGVGVVADFGSLLEMTDLELPRSLEADDGHQAAGEQALHDAHILRVHWWVTSSLNSRINIYTKCHDESCKHF